MLLRSLSICVFAGASVLTAGPGETSDPRPMSVDDALSMVRIDDVAITHDGRQVFYSERRLNWDANRYDRTYYLVSSAGGERRNFVGEAGGQSFQFTPDDAALSFLRKVDGADQVHLLPLTGGEATALTSHPGGIESFRWARDGRRLFFVAEEQRDPKAQAEWDAGGDAVFVGEGPNGFEAGQWSNLWGLEVASGEEQRLTDLPLTIESFDVDRDGEHIVFSGLTDPRANYDFRSDLYRLDIADRKVTRLTANEAPEDRPTYSPDGKWIAYHSPDARWYDLRNGYLWIMDAATGEARKLEGQCRGEIGEFVWSRDGKAILFSESRGVNTNLYRLDVATDAVEAVTAIEGTLRPRAFSENGRRVVYTREDFATPPDLYASNLRGQGEVRLTRCNAGITKERLLGEGRTVRWRSTDGREVEGVLVLPSGADPGTKLPLILNIHGGPPGFFGNEFDPEFHLHAGLGYAVFGPNPRGSSSYGDEFLRALMGDVGGGEYDDLMSGVDHLIGEGVVDPDRLALRGWSWGGILGAWTITRTNRFAAASLGAMVGDWFAETGGGVMFDMRLHYIGSEPYADPAEWRKRSALTYVANVVTPTLLLHGEDDDVSTVNQSLMFYTALRDRGVPVRMIKFPRQGHSIREPRLDRIRAVEEIRFIQRYTNDVEWASGPFVPRASDEDDAISSPPAPDLSWLAADRVLSDTDRYLIDRMHAGKVPGLAAAVVAGGRIVYSGGFGWAEIEKQRPVTTDTLFQLASVSKTVTACVVMQCVENGALDLDADIDALLPFEVNHPSHPDAKITLRQLLTHTGGLRDDWEVLEGTWVKNGDFPRPLGSSLREYLTPRGAWYDATENFQDWAPGTVERYSNVGIALAAYLAEVAAGRPFEELCAERVFRPLGMEHSSFRLRDLDFRDLAMPYVVGSDGRFEPQGHHGYLDFPSGTLRTSVTQLARFLLSFIGDGALGDARVLRKETVEAMRRVQFPEIAPEQGLVWHYSELGGRRVLGHDGSDPGVATVMRFRPDDGVGVILLTNGDLESGVEEQLLERLFALASR